MPIRRYKSGLARHATEYFHAVIHDEHSGGLMNMITHAALALGQ